MRNDYIRFIPLSSSGNLRELNNALNPFSYLLKWKSYSTYLLELLWESNVTGYKKISAQYILNIIIIVNASVQALQVMSTRL